MREFINSWKLLNKVLDSFNLENPFDNPLSRATLFVFFCFAYLKMMVHSK
jgi:hypothetical protein